MRETVPDWVVDEADQVELIDMAPEALIQRMKHGNIYSARAGREALDNFFTPGNLPACATWPCVPQRGRSKTSWPPTCATRRLKAPPSASASWWR